MKHHILGFLSLLPALVLFGALGGCGGEGCRSEAAAPVLVDATLPMGPGGAAFAFTVAEPMSVDVQVELPMELVGQAIIGPLYAAMRPHLVYEPDAAEDRVFSVEGCSGAPQTFELAKAGMYAVRIPAIPTAMGEMPPSVRVVVKVHAP